MELNGFPIEAVLAGHMLVLVNNDQPGVVGAVGRALGEHKINIGNMQLGRDRAGGRAISIVNVDSPVPPEIMDKLRRLPQVLSVKQVRV